MSEKFKISNLDLYYGDFHALKDINMSIHANEITAFIGPSGCGKSTFLKSLNRMNDLVEGCKITGNVLLDGEDIYKGMDPTFTKLPPTKTTSARLYKRPNSPMVSRIIT